MRILTGAIAMAAVYTAFALIPIGGAEPDAVLTLGCALALAMAIAVVASLVNWSRRLHFEVWFLLLYLNLAAVAVEGRLFAPAVARPAQLPANLAQLAVASLGVAGVAAAWFGRRQAGWRTTPVWPVTGWVWRLVVAAGVYFVLYLVIGGINFTLVTKPYYETHAGGVSMPPAEVIFVYEPVRGLMIALSVLLLTTAMQNRIEVVAVVAGMMLFIVGGLAPLLPQTSLPLYLRVASLWEILGQNFLAGVVCAYLFVEPKRRVRFSSGKERSYVSANR